MNDITPEMKNVLDFIDGKRAADDYTKALEQEIESVRKNEKWRLDYMTLQMKYQEKYEQGMEQGIEKGMEQGIEQGEAMMGMLMNRLLLEGRLEDARLAAVDETARKCFYEEYNMR